MIRVRFYNQVTFSEIECSLFKIKALFYFHPLPIMTFHDQGALFKSKNFS